jgi:hypothetical protein
MAASHLDPRAQEKERSRAEGLALRQLQRGSHPPSRTPSVASSLHALEQSSSSAPGLVPPSGHPSATPAAAAGAAAPAPAHPPGAPAPAPAGQQPPAPDVLASSASCPAAPQSGGPRPTPDGAPPGGPAPPLGVGMLVGGLAGVNMFLARLGWQLLRGTGVEDWLRRMIAAKLGELRLPR